MASRVTPSRRNRRRRSRFRRVHWVRLAALAVCLGVFLYSSISLIDYWVSSRKNHNANEELQYLHNASDAVSAETEDGTEEIAEPSPTPEPVPAQTPEPAAESDDRYAGVFLTSDGSDEDAPQGSDPAPTPEPAPEPEPTPEPEPAATYHKAEGRIMDNMRELLEINDDLVGWLKINGVVDLPVVYKNNELYLDHSFFGQKSDAGALFLDVNYPFRADAQHLLIHGHHMFDGSMFGKLTGYRDAEFGLNHPFASFQSLYEQEDYVLVAVLLLDVTTSDSKDLYFYSKPRFGDAADLSNYVAQLRKHSLYFTDVDVKSFDCLLTLSTCQEWNERLLVVFRKMRTYETREKMTDRFLTK